MNYDDEDVISFLRKWIAGDLKEKFGHESREISHYFAGDLRIEFSYEKNSSWI